MFNVYCLMFTVGCLLFNVYCLMFTVGCLLFNVYCILKFRICHLASVTKGGKLCITAGRASVANGTCGLEYGKSMGVLEEGERNHRAFCTESSPSSRTVL